MFLNNMLYFYVFNRMDGPARNTKKEIPKRARNPPKKMDFYEPDPGIPRDDSDGN